MTQVEAQRIIKRLNGPEYSENVKFEAVGTILNSTRSTTELEHLELVALVDWLYKRCEYVANMQQLRKENK